MRYLEESGIEIERGPAHCPQANTVAERFNQTFFGRLQSQLYQSGLPLNLWGEAASYLSLLINLSPTKALDFASPNDIFDNILVTHSHPLDISRLKPFGCLAFALDQKTSSKVSPVAKHYIFFGLELNAQEARLWEKNARSVLVTGDVPYQETTFPALDKAHSPQINLSTLIKITPADLPSIYVREELLTIIPSNPSLSSPAPLHLLHLSWPT